MERIINERINSRMKKDKGSVVHCCCAKNPIGKLTVVKEKNQKNTCLGTLLCNTVCKGMEYQVCGMSGSMLKLIAMLSMNNLIWWRWWRRACVEGDLMPQTLSSMNVNSYIVQITNWEG